MYVFGNSHKFPQNKNKQTEKINKNKTGKSPYTVKEIAKELEKNGNQVQSSQLMNIQDETMFCLSALNHPVLKDWKKITHQSRARAGGSPPKVILSGVTAPAF